MLFLSTSNPPNTSYSWGIKGLCPMLSASLLNAFGFRHCTRALAVRSRHPSYKSTEGLRLVLCFAFNYGIRVYTHNPASAFGVQSGRQECYTRSDDGRGIRTKTFACDRMEDTTRHLFRDLCLRCGALDQ